VCPCHRRCFSTLPTECAPQRLGQPQQTARQQHALLQPSRHPRTPDGRPASWPPSLLVGAAVLLATLALHGSRHSIQLCDWRPDIEWDADSTRQRPTRAGRPEACATHTSCACGTSGSNPVLEGSAEIPAQHLGEPSGCHQQFYPGWMAPRADVVGVYSYVVSGILGAFSLLPSFFLRYKERASGQVAPTHSN